MPVMRVSDAVVEAVTEWARPLESRPKVLDRLLKLATDGPPEEWLVKILGAGALAPPLVQALTDRLLSRWAELREMALSERLGSEPEEDEEDEKEVTP